jgi:hypothetical protein
MMVQQCFWEIQEKMLNEVQKNCNFYKMNSNIHHETKLKKYDSTLASSAFISGSTTILTNNQLIP